ncbi:MAG: LamG-like jellyroll fold domain-containing protein [Bacteroidota bacterium]
MKKLLSFLLLLLATIYCVNAQIPTNGLVAYYPFNGNANDESGNGNNGTVNGATLTADRFGNVDKAYSFDGVSNYIKVLDDTSLHVSNITISGWINPNAFNSYLNAAGYWAHYSGFICKDPQDKNNQSCFSTSANQNFLRIQASCTDGSYSDVHISNSVNLNSWQHIVYIYNNGSVKIYKDGILLIEDNTNLGNLLSTNNEPLLIGKTYWFPSASLLISYFSGAIDDIRIYNRALNETEIDSLYHEGGWAVPHQFAVHDVDGNGYDTVTIGTQTWLKQNLNVTHYRNGDAIPNVTDNYTWATQLIGALFLS